MDEHILADESRWPGWRARLILDPDPLQPYGDALAPALIIHRRRAEIAAEVFRPAQATRILRAWQDIGDRALFCRHLEFFHGTSNIEQATDHHSTELLIFDTGDYRSHTGATRPCDLSGDRAEWQAWLDGDVWGVHIEHRQPGGWTCTDSLWGLFGGDYARQTAQQLLADCATP